MDENKLIAALQEKMRAPGLAQRSGVHKSIVSRAVNNRRGLSPDASKQIGEAIGVNPVALHIVTNVAAKAASVDAGEISTGDALASLSRVAVAVDKMHKAGELDTSGELTEAITLLGDAIKELSASTGKSVSKFAGLSEEAFADGLRAEGRDIAA